MAGLGWGTIEAVIVHTIPVFLTIIAPGEELLTLIKGYEWTLLFGGFERIMAQIFHYTMMILVFYGVKYKLRNIRRSEPIAEIFLTKDPKPVWLWVIIVAILHFLFDFIVVLLFYTYGIVFSYLAGFVFAFLFLSYTSNRQKAYPLFPSES